MASKKKGLTFTRVAGNGEGLAVYEARQLVTKPRTDITDADGNKLDDQKVEVEEPYLPATVKQEDIDAAFERFGSKIRGLSLAADSSFQVRVAVRLPGPCPNCGEPTEDEWSHCANCGTKLD